MSHVTDDPYWFWGQEVKGQAHSIICSLLHLSFINEIFIVCEYIYALVLYKELFNYNDHPLNKHIWQLHLNLHK